MDYESKQKVIAAGFTILRSEDQPTTRIKCIRPGDHHWNTWQKYDTKAERDRQLKKLLSEPNYIQD